MTAKTAIAFALKHGASIGRYKPGIYYVTHFRNGVLAEQIVYGRTVGCTAVWIADNLTPCEA